MKILLACPGLNNPKCGIGNYTRHFATSLALFSDIVCYGGPIVGLYDRVLEVQPDVVHLQFEYGWASPERLRILSNQLQYLRVRFVITFHTVGQTPHNEIHPTCKIVVHDEWLKRYFPDPKCCTAIPLAIQRTNPSTTEITFPKREGVTRIGWFGNVFFHKGLHKLFDREFHPVQNPLEFLVLGGVPPHSTEYYARCRELAAQSARKVLWCTEYLDDSAVVAHLATCDAIVFPYDEYGATGCSAALRLALNAEKICYVSSTSHFLDIRQRKRAVIATLFGESSTLYLGTKQEKLAIVKEANKLRTEWSFPSIVSRHMEEVYV